MRSNRVAILGGGPAGLYAALLLARRDIPAILFEREALPGGLTAGTMVSGMHVDYGSHRLHPSIDPDILTDLQSILGDDLQRRRRKGRMLLDGAWVSFPVSPAELLTRLRPTTLARLAAGGVGATARRGRSDTFSDFVVTGLGRPMGELFYFPYARKIWGLDPTRLDGEQARRRISAATPWSLLRQTFRRSGTREFYYPSHGFGQIARALSDAASRAGAEICLGAPVTSIERNGDSFRVATPKGSSNADLVLSTIPISALARSLEPSNDIAAALESLDYRAMVLVYLTVRGSHWTTYDAHYFPSASVPFTRISEPTNYRDGEDPTERSVICVEIPVEIGDDTWTADDEVLTHEIRHDIIGAGLPDPGTDGYVHRIPSAYPIYRVGAGRALDVVTSWLDGIEGVVTFGRQGLFAHDNTHHALAMARDAVSCISNDLSFDAAAWSRARQRFSRHVVED